MPDAAGLAVLLATALVASVIAGVAGFGAGIILLPVLAWTVGIKAAAPVLTVTMLLGNLSRLCGAATNWTAERPFAICWAPFPRPCSES